VVIKEVRYPAGGCVRVHDDCMVKTDEENQEIIRRVSNIMVAAERGEIWQR